MKKIVSNLFVLGAASALVIACAASTQAPEETGSAGEGTSADATVSADAGDAQAPAEVASSSHIKPEVDGPSCVDSLGPTTNIWFQNSCTSNNVASSTTYGSGACPYYGVEWSGTSVNTSNAFLASVNPGSLTEAECTNTTISVTFLGFDDTKDSALYGVGNWDTVQTVTQQGNWNGFNCNFGALQSGIPLSAVISNPAPEWEPLYTYFMAYVQSATTTTDKSQTSTSYNQVSVNLAPATCAITL